ncbi:MAG: hypothetical protein MUD01_26170, partial [Chloroflexaceae bacterium]|nr:hypothetical protein [Chloroflexaceae bacterium]
TPVERLEGAKFRGIPGIGSLQQFLAVPEKYNLKYVFSNDQFYDPLLYFSGWHRVQRLENGIMVWERADIPPLPEVLPRREIPIIQRLMWGTVPMSALLLALSLLGLYGARYLGQHVPAHVRRKSSLRFRGVIAAFQRVGAPPRHLLARVQQLWQRFDHRLYRWSRLPNNDHAPAVAWQVWMEWLQRLPRPQPAPPSARLVRGGLLLAIGLAGLVAAGLWYSSQTRTPAAVLQAYYDDLDFRRFGAAYNRLDPQTRPTFAQFELDRSVEGGLLASYSKLDAVRVQTLAQGPERAELLAESTWITALKTYTTSRRYTLVQRDGSWFLQLERIEKSPPLDAIQRRLGVAWHVQSSQQGHEQQADAFRPPLDRPEVEILSARLVQQAGRYSLVGELRNRDADPGDVTVTAMLFGQDGSEVSRYNAQTLLMHKLLPQEVTPFRVDFEGIAGVQISDHKAGGDFSPEDYTPPDLTQALASFQVYAKAVVTGYDLYRDVAAQGLHVVTDAQGQVRLHGELINNGTLEATIPQLLLTYYDADGRVTWVDQQFLERSIAPQQTQTFDITLTPASALLPLSLPGESFPSASPAARMLTQAERLPLPPGLGFASVRVSVNYFVGGTR